ncbi:caspase family protein [Streptomyces cinereoruber]|uniref:caspase family protein n=1 Tax=Streptomyces cinereoruber TaxID=67260 RepID=UPI00362E81DB
MARYKALLIGACEYDDEAIPSLPFVRDDLRRLDQALTGRAFQSVEIVESPRGIITTNVVNRHVRRFLQEAKRGDTLFVLLSGHGLHFEGKDYLIPEDASYEIQPFADGCVEIGWQKDLENSEADHVVFLIDACREGTERDVKAPAPNLGWKKRKIEATLRRKVAYVYACSKAQFARFVRENDAVALDHDIGVQPGESFSLFSRAVSDVVTSTTHQLDIAGFVSVVQERITELHTAYGKAGQVQQVRIDTDVPHHLFPVLPGPPRGASVHPWVRAVAAHPVWDLVTASATRDALQHVCATTADRLSKAYENSARSFHDDPWHDDDLVRRTLERLGYLAKLGNISALSPSEAALLVLLPLANQAFWAHEASQHLHVLRKTNESGFPEWQRFHDFFRGFPRLKRRLRTLDQRGSTDGSTERIRWWLYHRWLTRQPELYAPQSLKSLLGPLPTDIECPGWVQATLSEERLMRLLQDMRAAPFAVARRGPTAPDLIAAASPDEHVIRENLVGTLIKAAQAFAVDPLELPEIVVEHIGISDSVDLAGLLTTVRASDWRHSGMGRSLNALCDHPAVQIALREHARHADSLLRGINRSDHLDSLRGLPPYADADLVRLSGNTPARMSDGIRFQLAEDRVQELLMGEELYGERDLAIRELYQNALDAVRYRDRRTEFLRRSGRPTGAWEGRIDFVQGVDEQERPYLECRDNGVGMGIDELSKVFSQGGTRFVDLPEYIEEQAAWAELGEPKIELFPNSRFGIGVLSYFMLADEIEVRTCRMDLNGRPGNLLQVRIAGPGNLFRIDDLGPGTEPGTVVKLLLTESQEAVSCVETLKQVLWLAPYRTTACHGAFRHEWEPRVLSPEGHEHQLERLHMGHAGPYSFQPSNNPDVWWTDGIGWLLADGLYAESPRHISQALHGSVVNLTGERQPDLTIDRKKIRRVNEEHVISRMTEAIPSLLESASHLLTPPWLARTITYSMAFADSVAELAMEKEFSWPLGNISLSVGDVGFFEPDSALLPLVNGHYDESGGALLAAVFRNIPSPLLRWRLLTLYRAGLGAPLNPALADSPPLLMAKPSDLSLVLRRPKIYHQSWNYFLDEWLSGINGGPFTFTRPTTALTRTGMFSLGQVFRWRDPRHTVDTNAIFELIEDTKMTAGQIAERLRGLGFTVAPLHGAELAGPADVPLIRAGSASYLTPGAAIDLAQIHLSAARSELSPHEVAKRLEGLGFSTPANVSSSAHTPEERRVLGNFCMISTDNASKPIGVVTSQIVTAAHASGVSTRSAAKILQRCGFQLACSAESLPDLSDGDKLLLSHRSFELEPGRPVPAIHIAAVANRTGRSIEQITARLTTLGFAPPRVQEAHITSLSRENLHFLLPLQVRWKSEDWPYSGRPLNAFEIADITRAGETTLEKATDRLQSLGHACDDAALLNGFSSGDLDYLRFRFVSTPATTDPLDAATVEAVAHHVGSSYEDIAAHLSAFGFTVLDPDPEWLAEHAAEQSLVTALIDAQDESTDPPGAVGLPTMAAVAAQLRLPFKTVTDKATELGMRHEAEGWFAPAPQDAA